MDLNDMLNGILKNLSEIDEIPLEDIPDIDLYMDQVTTLMETKLAATKRYEEDKILTKTMINNYAKNHLLPPPVRKKYSREHVLVLIWIYYFKNIMSIKDIERLLSPVTEKHFHTNEPLQIGRIYEEISRFEKERSRQMPDEVRELFHSTQSLFQDAGKEERTRLQTFAFICSLSVDVYLKKILVERLIDQLSPPEKKERKGLP